MGIAPRSYYIDNLRIFLTALVVLHHWAITYGAPGLWYYNEGNPNEIAKILLALFVAINQAFFMGMFFLISSYFLDRSWQRKSKKELLKDKLIRLGVPLLIYVFIISPTIIYLKRAYIQDVRYTSVFSFFAEAEWFTFGPLWFIVALLLFTLIAILLKPSRNKNGQLTNPLPGNITISVFIIAIGLVSFLVRTRYPIGWSLHPVGFQLAHFTQYLSLFFIGFIASRNDWFNKTSYQQGVKWFRIVLILVFIISPIGFFMGGILEGSIDIFMGGWTWPSLFYSLWEQAVGIGIMISLLGIFKEKYNAQGKSLKMMSASAYSVYVIHALILVIMSILIKDMSLSSTSKSLVFAPVILVICFGLGNLLRKLSLLRKIL